MTKKIFIISALGAIVVAVVAGLAQTATTKAAAPASKQQKLVKVCTLPTVQANQEFQTNVQFMQAERQVVIDANAAYEKETNAAKKKELQTKRDGLLAKLNDDNQKMVKAYGFSLDHAYTLAIEKADVYMLVTDEEAAKIEQAQATAGKK